MSNQRRPDLSTETLWTAYQDLGTLEAVAVKYGVSKVMVWKRLQKAGHKCITNKERLEAYWKRRKALEALAADTAGLMETEEKSAS